jgi:hypothetical protein
VLSIATLAACKPIPAETVVSAPQTSVAELVKRLPSLGSLAIEECEFVVTRDRIASHMPAPSDTMIEVKGQFRVGASGVEWLKSLEDWEEIAAAELPEEVLAFVPAIGRYWVSRTLNESFFQFGKYPCGYVVFPPESRWEAGFVVARDLDHCIEEDS